MLQWYLQEPDILNINFTIFVGLTIIKHQTLNTI